MSKILLVANCPGHYSSRVLEIDDNGRLKVNDVVGYFPETQVVSWSEFQRLFGQPEYQEIKLFMQK